MKKTFFFTLFLFVFCLFFSSLAHSQGVTTSWENNEQGNIFHVTAVNALNDKQTIIINSGFSTFVKFELLLSIQKQKPVTLTSKTCTVQFDAWEEYYDIVLLSETPELIRANAYEDLAQSCLSISITGSKNLELIKDKENTVIASLQIEQISKEQSNEVRKWLIKQQSGVMPGLFSLMLGDLKMSEGYETEIKVYE